MYLMKGYTNNIVNGPILYTSLYVLNKLGLILSSVYKKHCIFSCSMFAGERILLYKFNVRSYILLYKYYCQFKYDFSKV